jgi:putative FmdB family regulatory protein
MPVYEYRCKSCEKEFEKYLGTAATAVACPACASAQVMRKLSVFGVKAAPGDTASAMPMGGGGCCGGGCACH